MIKGGLAAGVAVTSLLAVAAIVRGDARSEAGSDPARTEIARAAQAMKAQLVEWRRDFHMHPELSNREERTSRVIAERLRSFGLD